MATPAPAGHRRNKSSSVLKSIVLPKHHKRAPSDGTALKANPPDAHLYNPAAYANGMPLLPPDHPHSQFRPVSRKPDASADLPPSPRKSHETRASPIKSLHKKTLSSVSLRSLGRDKDKDKEQERGNASKSREPSRTRRDDVSTKSPTKTKSRTNLTSLFLKGRQAKETKEVMEGTVGDKENTTPPNASTPLHTPIWAEFSSQPLHEITTTSKVPLNDQRRSIEEEIALYTPNDYSPSKGRNFFDYGQPSLQKRPQAKERPKSTFLPNTSTTSLLSTFSRKRSDERVPLGDTKGNETRTKESPSKNLVARGMLGRHSSEISQENTSPKKIADAAKKQNRVMAAVAALNGRSKQPERSTPASSPTKLDPKVVDAEFEAVLVSQAI